MLTILKNIRKPKGTMTDITKFVPSRNSIKLRSDVRASAIIPPPRWNHSSRQKETFEGKGSSLPEV